MVISKGRRQTGKEEANGLWSFAFDLLSVVLT